MNPPEPLRFVDDTARTDLATYVARARRVDPDGVARLQAHGLVLAVYVSPLHSRGVPTVLGLRTVALADPSAVDVVVPLSAIADRLARPGPVDPALAIPPVEVTGVSWAGVSPPRSGWVRRGDVLMSELAAAAREGVAQVAGGTPPHAGAPVVARLRAVVWGRSLAGVPGLPAGAALAADALGFLVGTQAPVYSQGPWWRVSTGRGHVLARSGGLG